MEDLNKNQIVLLTILISFVTSIATGIMTTSLLMEAPVEVTQTINRVVEKTIETVTPADTTEKITNKPKEKEVTTVVVSEEDRVIDSIAKNTKSIVRIREKNDELGINNFYAMGLVVNTEGLIITDKKLVSDVMKYSAILSDGQEVPLVSASSLNKKSSFGFFLAKPKDKIMFYPALIASSEPKLGQSVISIGGDSRNAISVGRVASLSYKDQESTTTPKTLSSIETDFSPVDGVFGSPIISLSGEVLGINISDVSSSKVFTPSGFIKKEIGLFENSKSN
jgi:S1-C subfamily serine protease